MIELVGLTKHFGSQTAVHAIDLTVETGELMVLVGGSGSGKTTTLRMINRLIEPSSGRVRIDGRPHDAEAPHLLRRRIGYAFQRIGLFPHLTVAQNIATTPKLLGWDEARIQARVDELLELVELEPAEYRNRRPAALSGGQQQRVGVARALAAEPGVLLMDEPFGALDPITRESLQGGFRAIQKRLNVTCVFVTHDMAEALLLGDRIAVMKEGRMLQVARPRRLLDEPADPYVEEMVATPLRQARALESVLGQA